MIRIGTNFLGADRSVYPLCWAIHVPVSKACEMFSIILVINKNIFHQTIGELILLIDTVARTPTFGPTSTVACLPSSRRQTDSPVGIRARVIRLSRLEFGQFLDPRFELFDFVAELVGVVSIARRKLVFQPWSRVSLRFSSTSAFRTYSVSSIS